MSNAETLQQNNTRLGKNNTDLNSLLNTVRKLPNQPTEEIAITENGVYDIKNYASANVDVHEPTPYAPRIISFRDYTGTELDYEIANLDTSNIKTFAYLFYNNTNLKKLDLSNFDTIKVTALNYMFLNNMNLTNLDLSNWNTSNVKTMSNMFYNCRALTELNLSHFDTSNVTEIRGMFGECSKLVDLNMENCSMDSLKSNDTAFYSCTKLQNLKFPKNWGKAYTQKSTNYSYYTISLHNSNDLTHDSLMSVINNIYDLNLSYNVAGGGTLYTQTLQLGATNTAKLTAEEINVAVQKGWTVS